MATPPTTQENMLGPYRLLRLLGEGGMGRVYLAHDPALNRHLAIKVLREAPEHSARAAASIRKRFIREAQSAAKLNHPHVVTIYAVGTHAAQPYIAMEYVEGGNLSQKIAADGPLFWRPAAEAMRDALRGLAAAHHAGVVHRDIKPANLMCARDMAGIPLIKLADFGLARIATLTDPDITFPGAFVGSPNYSAPEQIAGSRQVDGRADLYSLAATGYALLTGQPPFMADDPADVMEQHLHAAFPDPRRLAPTVPAQLAALLARATQKRPDDRFASAAAMLAAVKEILALPADVRVPPPPAAPSAAPLAALPHAPRDAGLDATVSELETRLAAARRSADSSTQLETLRTLFGLYNRLDRQDDARRAYREALVIHVKMREPQNN